MSCRILGRQVEHCILHKLQAVALSMQCSHVGFPLEHSEKNTPIRELLEKLFATHAIAKSAYGADVDYVVPVAELAPEAIDAIVVHDEVFDVAQMGKAAAASSTTAARDAAETADITAQLCGLIRENLSLSVAVGAQHSYFGLGGNSLKAVDLVVKAARQGLSF